MTNQYSSFPFLVLTTFLAWVIADLTPLVLSGFVLPYSILALVEGILLLQLLLAWNASENRLSIGMLVLFVLLFVLRIGYRTVDSTSLLWGLRMAAVHNPFLGFIVYTIGIAALHPDAYAGVQRIALEVAAWSKQKRIIYFTGWLLILGFLFWALRSKNISRDGQDWILRTIHPVWHLYMREPLTIGLYRLVFCIARPLTYCTSYHVIAGLSMVSGVWGLFWYDRFLKDKCGDTHERILGWLLLLSTGGLLVLFFGHMEVYPILIGGLFPTFYFANRYLTGQVGIVPVALFFSIAFLLHLSAGWLLPAFLLLPFFKRKRTSTAWDCFLFLALYGSVQILFWTFLFTIYYGADPARFFARLHETFFVGPDRAMFLPVSVWFHPWRLWDLCNEYLYLSIPSILLTPIAMCAWFRRRRREDGFWILAFAGYFVYSAVWNPDRGFPEDWDLFSPLTLLSLYLLIHMLIGADRSPNQSNDSEPSIHNRTCLYVYLVSMGTFPFALAQIWYHHITPLFRFG